MQSNTKQPYVRPQVVKHELLRDITATRSGYNCDEEGGWWWNKR